MSSKSEKDKTKQLQDRCQSVLNTLLRDEDNKYCVDCDSKGPRWASWNIGVFLCIRCAGIHRNLGVHISRVKSVNLDSWTPEQVVSLQQMGNSRARAVYEANLPDNFRRPQNDSSLESFIRAKYEHKKYIAREWVPPSLPKVNWEKEIEEEMVKHKRKPKTIVEKKSFVSVEVPQLPKPKNPSPKPNRIVNPEIKKDSDLLGLQNGDDSFSSFLGAPEKVEEKKVETKDDGKSEEESFFNQTVPVEKEKVKLSKDSILSLYGSAPMNSFNQFPNSLGQSSGMYQGGGFPMQNNFQPFGGFSQQNYPIQNGLSGQFATQLPNQWGMQNQQFPSAQNVQVPVSQYPSNTHPMQQNFNNFQNTTNTQFPVVGQHLQQNTNLIPGQPNPFSSCTPNNLHQQFTNLNLNGQTSNNGAATLTSNIWQ